MKPCSSAHRCARVSCSTCCWRYSLGVSRRILDHDPSRLHAIMIAEGLSGPVEFATWRVGIRNLVDHRRRQDRWWREAGLWLWLSRDGAVRGIATLGAVTQGEFVDVLDRRWTTTLRPIEITAVREEIWLAVKPSVIADAGQNNGRYQRIRAVVKPQRASSPARSSYPQSQWADVVEPLPIFL